MGDDYTADVSTGAEDQSFSDQDLAEPGDTNLDYAESDQAEISQSMTPQEIELTLNGENRKVNLDEARALAQMGADYTRKTQALAMQARELEPFMHMAEMFSQNPQLEQAVAQMLYEQTTGQPYDPQQIQLQLKEQEIAHREGVLNWHDTLLDFASNNPLPEEHMAAVVQLMAQEGIRNPYTAYDVFQSRLNGYMQQRSQQRPAVIGRSGYGSPPSRGKAPSNFDEAKSAALNFLKQANKQNY